MKKPQTIMRTGVPELINLTSEELEHLTDNFIEEHYDKLDEWLNEEYPEMFHSHHHDDWYEMVADVAKQFTLGQLIVGLYTKI